MKFCDVYRSFNKNTKKFADFLLKFLDRSGAKELFRWGPQVVFHGFSTSTPKVQRIANLVDLEKCCKMIIC